MALRGSPSCSDGSSTATEAPQGRDIAPDAEEVHAIGDAHFDRPPLHLIQQRHGPREGEPGVRVVQAGEGGERVAVPFPWDELRDHQEESRPRSERELTRTRLT